MPKSIRPGVEVFQYAIRHKPTGKYLKKTSGSSFYETDIPAVYNSPKVALRSLENASKWSRHKVADCEIVKFRLIMEEVKEPTPAEIEYEKELKSLNLLRKVIGEHRWEEVEGERAKWEIFNFITNAHLEPISSGSSLHCFDEVYETKQCKYQLLWTHGQKDEMPASISRSIPNNWDEKIKALKFKYGIK